MDVERIARSEVLKAVPYEGPFVDIKERRRIAKLDLNENLLLPKGMIRRLLLKACKEVDLRFYPSPYGALAAEAISDFLGLDKSCIFVGNGEDNVLDSIARTLIGKESKVVIVEPTFSVYANLTRMYGGQELLVHLKSDFSLDVDAVIRECGRGSVLVFICSPNNPTGNQFESEGLINIIRSINGIVILDEAYGEFSKYSTIELTKDFDNLIVLKTFSKAFGMAGIRLGYFVSNRSIVNLAKRVARPFDVNAVAERLVKLALENWKYFSRYVEDVVKERDRLLSKLAKIEGVAPYPSETNFILFKITCDKLSSSIVTEALRRRGVFVKDFGSNPLLNNCIRVTVGPRKINERFLDALEEALEDYRDEAPISRKSA